MQSLKFYKPSDKGSGSAFQFKIGFKSKNKEPVVFIEATRQNGPKPAPGSKESPFNWKEKVVIMLNHNELGDILAYIGGLDKKSEVIKIVHATTNEETKKSVSGFELKRPTTDDEKKYGNWAVSLRRDKNAVMGRLTPGEVYQFKLLCESIVNMYIFQEEIADDRKVKSNENA